MHTDNTNTQIQESHDTLCASVVESKRIPAESLGGSRISGLPTQLLPSCRTPTAGPVRFGCAGVCRAGRRVVAVKVHAVLLAAAQGWCALVVVGIERKLYLGFRVRV